MSLSGKKSGYLKISSGLWREEYSCGGLDSGMPLLTHVVHTILKSSEGARRARAFLPAARNSLRNQVHGPHRPLYPSCALRKLGQDIRDARRRRRIPVAILAERASNSRMTLNRIEKGDAGVSVGNFATALFVLGLIDRVADLADAAQDRVGRELEEERLPERIRLSRPSKSKTPKESDR